MEKLTENDLGFIEGYYKALLNIIKMHENYNYFVKDAFDTCPEDRKVLESLFSKEDMRLIDIYIGS